MAGEVVSPPGVAIDGQSFFDSVAFFPFLFLSGWNEAGPARERADGGEFVAEGCVGVEWDVLICVCGLPVNIKGERAVSAAMDLLFLRFHLLLVPPLLSSFSFPISFLFA